MGTPCMCDKGHEYIQDDIPDPMVVDFHLPACPTCREAWLKVHPAPAVGGVRTLEVCDLCQGKGCDKCNGKGRRWSD